MAHRARFSDAELIERLQLVEKHKSASAAARVVGISEGQMRSAVREAKARGLSAESVVEDEVAKLQTRLKITEASLDAVHRENNTAETIRKKIYGLAEETPDPPKWIAKQSRGTGSTGVPVTIWSDWHWGERVFREQVGGVNEYDRKIAKQRLQRLVDGTIDLATKHMTKPDYPGVVVCLGGDIISGTIHDELRETNDGPVQQTLIEVQEQLIAALTHMADVFGRVFVPCVVGNHGRNTLKPRAKNRVYDSYEWNLYCQLERWFSAKGDDRVQFQIPGDTDAYFSVLGHRILLTHGDTLGVRGGDGIIGVIGPIARGTFKVGRSEAQIGRDFDTLVGGHYHTRLPRGDAIPAIFNGSMIGYNEYGRYMLRVPYSRPSQELFFINEEHGLTAEWPIYLEPRLTASVNSEWVTWQVANKS